MRNVISIQAHPSLHRLCKRTTPSSMDYSASIQDADHPAGGSPWGNSPVSSPQAHRTAFGAVAGESPASPASPPPFGSQIPGNGFAAAQEEGGFGTLDRGFEPEGGPASVAENEAYTTEAAPEDVPAGQQQHGQFGDENVSPSQTYNSNRQPGDITQATQGQQQGQHQLRKPSQPTYKLQAKITGLERAARKDPILRFDVHVSMCLRLAYILSLTKSRRPTSPNFELHNSAMSGACTPNLSSWPST